MTSCIAREKQGYIYFFFFNLTYSRWTSSLPSCLWSLRTFPSPPGPRLTSFYCDASSALLQLVNQWLNFTYSRSHAFRYERKNTNPTLVRIELTTSALAGVQVTYETTRATMWCTIWARDVTSSHITKCFKRTRYCNSVLIILTLRFRYKRYLLHVVLDYLMEKTAYNTRRGHKRSSGHERYPSPIQASLSCCASSKGYT